MPDTPEIRLYIPCNNDHGQCQGYASHMKVRVEGDRVLQLEDPTWLPALESDDRMQEVLTNCVVDDLHGEPFMILRDEHFELAAWANMVGSITFRMAELTRPDQLFDVLGILIEDGWDLEGWRYRKAHQHWQRGFINAEDLHPSLSAHYNRCAHA